MRYRAPSASQMHEPQSFMAGSSSPTSSTSESVEGDSAQSSYYDLPELYYDLRYSSTPPSAASSSMIPTPQCQDASLPENSPYIMDPSESFFGDYSINEWSFSSSNAYHPYSGSYCSTEGKSTSTSYPREPSTQEWFNDELNWEKQRYQPDFSLPLGNHYSQAPSDQKPALSQLYPTSNSSGNSVRQDTRHYYTQPDRAPSASISSYVPNPAFNDTVSPSMLSLSNDNMPSPSSSSSTILSSSSEAPQTHTPITIHQPRPSRRIPIVSLAQLASASDELLRKNTARYLLSAQPKSPLQQALSPLPLDCHGFAAVPTTGYLQQSISKSCLPQGVGGPMVPNILLSTQQYSKLCYCGCMNTTGPYPMSSNVIR